MYPYIRLTKELIRQKFLKKISLSEVHTYYTICWPIDLDPWWELNNGRTLTLYDLGRISFLLRTGLNYHFKPNTSATFGYAHIGNYVYESEQKSPEVEEHRNKDNDGAEDRHADR